MVSIIEMQPKPYLGTKQENLMMLEQKEIPPKMACVRQKESTGVKGNNFECG